MKTEGEAREVLEQLADAIRAGTDRIEAEMKSQMQAWTLAGLEDRARDDERA